MTEKCGASTTSEQECLLSGCCYENDVCWKDATNIAGFTKISKQTNFLAQTTIKAKVSLTLKECSLDCLQNPDCKCFIYDHVNHICISSTMPCSPTGNVGNTFSYEKTAFQDVTCFATSCTFSEEHTNSSFTDCSNQCKQENDCKLFLYSTNSLPKKCKTQETSACDLKDDTKRKDQLIRTCLNGAITKESIESNQLVISPVSEGNCVTVTSDKDYSLRIPWPTINLNLKAFFIEIHGKNVRNCVNFSTNNLDHGLVVYTSISYQYEPDFLGKFFGCQTLSTTNDNYCKFECNCKENSCDAVYIKAFAEKGKSLEICNYTVLNS